MQQRQGEEGGADGRSGSGGSGRDRSSSGGGSGGGGYQESPLHQGQGLATASPSPDHSQLSLSFQAVEKLRVRSTVRGRLVSIYRQCLFALKDLNSSGGGSGGSPPSHTRVISPGSGSKSSSPSLHPSSASLHPTPTDTTTSAATTTSASATTPATRDASPSMKRTALVQALSHEVPQATHRQTCIQTDMYTDRHVYRQTCIHPLKALVYYPFKPSPSCNPYLPPSSYHRKP